MCTKGGHEVSKFSVAIPDQNLMDLKDRLRRTRFPEDFGTVERRPTFVLERIDRMLPPGSW